MGQTILTPHQSQFLELVGQEPDLVTDYYFTGGTALTEYYLKHRVSEDIDLFTEKSEVNQAAIEVFLKKISAKLGVREISKSQYLGLFNYYLHFKDGSNLKVDFNYYPFPRINKGKKYKDLEVDSIYTLQPQKNSKTCIWFVCF